MDGRLVPGFPAAAGAVPEGADTAEVLRTVRAVAGGEALFGPAIARRLTSFFQQAEGQGLSVSPFPALTDRERAILDLVAQGLDNRQIADRTSADHRIAFHQSA